VILSLGRRALSSLGPLVSRAAPRPGRKSLANLYDMNADYRVNLRFTLTAYLGYAQGLAAATAIYPNGKDAGLGYLEAFPGDHSHQPAYGSAEKAINTLPGSPPREG
jgi:hypothetical protein